MSSFDHQITPIDQHRRAGYWRNPIGYKCRVGVNRRRNNPGCENAVEYVCSYAYVTGRAGRVSTNEKGRCEEHAKRFASKHNIPMPSQEEAT